MRAGKMQRREPPYKTRPTESLWIHTKPIPSPMVIKKESETKREELPEQSGGVRIKRQLDEESGTRILMYIHQKKSPESERKTRNNTNALKLTKSGHKPDCVYYQGVGSTGGGGEKSFIDKSLDVLSKKTFSQEAIQAIDTHFLSARGITLALLIYPIQVKISELYAGGVLRTLQDLIEIGFRPNDLVLDRDLFNCDILANLYRTNYMDIVEKKIPFGEKEIISGGFLPSELKALDYDIHDAITAGRITFATMKLLNFSLHGFQMIGLKRLHLTTLGIKEKEAKELNWDYQQYLSFSSSS